MSQRLIDRNPDLIRLRNEGYDIEIRSGYLLMKQVPYVNTSRDIRLGVLVSKLQMNGEILLQPTDHVAHFAGEYPCNKDGVGLAKIVHSESKLVIDESFTADFMLSSKRKDRSYADYYEKMTTYARIIYSPAQALDPTVRAEVFPAVKADDDDSPFRYVDTASSRAGITAAMKKLELHKVAIVGLGGTGSYVLDLVSKAPVREIHIFDGDKFSNHNAFRSPGAATLTELEAQPQKVDYLMARYSEMHRRVIPHDYYLDAANVAELAETSFVFLCLDAGAAKQHIVELLQTRGVPFIDVGMGVDLDGDGLLGGIVRVTASTPRLGNHIKDRISFADVDRENDYEQNIQIADLNALNASLAVIKWKKLFGFYRDLEDEHFSGYAIDGNNIINEDKP